jgi:hypothetical protein
MAQMARAAAINEGLKKPTHRTMRIRLVATSALGQKQDCQTEFSNDLEPVNVSFQDEAIRKGSSAEELSGAQIAKISKGE